jgi:hypothetical protein
MTLTKVRTAFKVSMILTCQCEDWKKNDMKTCVNSKVKPNLSSNESKNISNNIVDSNAFPMGMWQQKVYLHRFCRLVTNTLGQTTQVVEKLNNGWNRSKIFRNLTKLNKWWKWNWDFLLFPTKSILSTFFVIDKFYLNLFLMMDNCVSKRLFLLCGRAGSNFKPKNFPYLIYNFSSRCIQFHPSDAHPVLTYICGSHIESSSNQNFMQNSMSMASVSLPYGSKPTDLISNSATLQFCEGWENKNREKCWSHQLLLSTGFPGQM